MALLFFLFLQRVEGLRLERCLLREHSFPANWIRYIGNNLQFLTLNRTFRVEKMLQAHISTDKSEKIAQKTTFFDFSFYFSY